MSVTEQSVKVSVSNLQGDHLFAFNRTLSSVLSTALAERTFAQIIDGLPTRDDVGYFPTYSKEIGDNTASSLEAMEAVRRLREHFNTFSTLVDVKVSSNPSFITADSDRLGSLPKLTRTPYHGLENFICVCWRC
jgi:hypothetical protein